MDFSGSQEFFDNINLISILFVTLLTVKITCYLSNFSSAIFNISLTFFAVVVVMGGVSSFYTDLKLLDIHT